MSARRRRRGPKGPKEGSRRPARHASLVARQLRGGMLRRRAVSGGWCGAVPVWWLAPARRAPRALDDVRKFSPSGQDHGCAADVDRLLGGRCCGLLPEAFVGGLAAEAAVGPMVVVEVLPLLEALVEQVGVVDDDALELAVELFAVDPV